jgi:hypothetical protein
MKDLTIFAVAFTLGAIFMKCRRDGKDLKREVEALRARQNPTATV